MSVIRVCCCNTLTLIHYCVYGSQDIMKTLWPDFSVQCTDVLQVSFAWQLCVADTHYVLVKCTHFIVWISDGHRGYGLRPISPCFALLCFYITYLMVRLHVAVSHNFTRACSVCVWFRLCWNFAKGPTDEHRNCGMMQCKIILKRDLLKNVLYM